MDLKFRSVINLKQATDVEEKPFHDLPPYMRGKHNPDESSYCLTDLQFFLSLKQTVSNGE